MTEPSPTPARPVTLLIVCALIAALAIAAALLFPGWLRDQPRREADATLRSFLDAAVTGDEWRDQASELLRDVVPVGAPLRGEEHTADALQLSIDYAVDSLIFSGETPATSDTAQATVSLRYEFATGGERGDATITQTIWLTRPFYFDDDEPRRADPDRRPSAVGPWRVTGITLPTTDTTAGTYGLRSDGRGPADDVHCYSPVKALAQLSDAARVDGTLTSSCYLGTDDGSDVIADGVDRAALIAAFPAVDDGDPASIPPELVRVERDALRAMRAPLTQYLVDERFVLTFAAVRTDEDQLATRLIRVDNVKAQP